MKKFIKVYVLNMRGQPLMPCSPVKTRILLKQGKAKVVKRTPFIIQLTVATGETTQPITLGVDSGYGHIGLSAVTNKMELFSAEVNLRSNIVRFMSERKMYRRNRRYHKTRYRKSRFLNRVRTKHKGWLAPSIQHKLDSHSRLIHILHKILPITKVVIEVANFDIQKIKNPDITGKDYQRGEQLGYNNSRAYVLHRDDHKCQYCKGKSHDKILTVHHLISRQTGGNRPDNLITLCKTCHSKHHAGTVQLKINILKGYRAESFMSLIRLRLVDCLKQWYRLVEITHGYITKTVREQLGLVKSHVNDAFVIASGNNQTRCTQFIVDPKRRNNRSLQLNRKGFRPSMRRQRYLYRPKDSVFIKGIWYVVKGMHSYGKQIAVFDKLGKVRSFSTKFIEQHYYQNGWRFNYV